VYVLVYVVTPWEEMPSRSYSAYDGPISPPRQYAAPTSPLPSLNASRLTASRIFPDSDVAYEGDWERDVGLYGVYHSCCVVTHLFLENEEAFDGGKLLHIFFLDDCGNVVRQWRTENGGGDGINSSSTPFPQSGIPTLEMYNSIFIRNPPGKYFEPTS
jgi:hypothetical protein